MSRISNRESKRHTPRPLAGQTAGSTARFLVDGQKPARFASRRVYRPTFQGSPGPKPERGASRLRETIDDVVQDRSRSQPITRIVVPVRRDRIYPGGATRRVVRQVALGMLGVQASHLKLFDAEYPGKKFAR